MLIIKIYHTLIDFVVYSLKKKKKIIEKTTFVTEMFAFFAFQHQSTLRFLTFFIKTSRQKKIKINNL